MTAARVARQFHIRTVRFPLICAAIYRVSLHGARSIKNDRSRAETLARHADSDTTSLHCILKHLQTVRLPLFLYSEGVACRAGCCRSWARVQALVGGPKCAWRRVRRDGAGTRLSRCRHRCADRSGLSGLCRAPGLLCIAARLLWLWLLAEVLRWVLRSSLGMASPLPALALIRK
jgi:hypothetical protein